MKKMILTLTAAVFLAALVGCSTVKGVGQDVQSVGNGIEDVATDVQKQM